MAGHEQTSGVGRAEVVGILSCATSLALGQPADFCLRSCVIAMAMGARLGYGPAELETLYWYALLRYAGCNSENHAFSALVGDEVEFNRRFLPLDSADLAQLMPMLGRLIAGANGGRGPLVTAAAVAIGLAQSKHAAEVVIGGHCDVAQRLAVRLEFGDAVITALGQSRERWDGKGLFGTKGPDQLPAVRLMPVCNDALVLLPLWGMVETLAILRKRAGSVYDPEIVATFLPVAEPLITASESAPWEQALALDPAGGAELGTAQLEDACLVLADFCDLKLPHAISHSRSVAALAGEAGKSLRLPADQLEALQRAALLHDIGYAALPVRARGGYAERLSAQGDIKLHPFHGEELVGRAAGLRPAAGLLGRHHEAMDGSGYFRGLNAQALPAGARILGAAEFYQTALEGRFSAPPLDSVAAAAALRAEVTAGRIDGEAAKAVLAAAGHRVPIKKTGLVAGLTNRELDILRLAASGLSMKEIGQKLGISPKTVDNHLQNLYPKIEVKTRAGATLFAIEHGLCSLPK